MALLILLVLGCKKNFNNSIVTEHKKESYDFFKLPNDAPLVVKKIAAKMKSDNDKYNFIENFAKQFGVPVWEKVKIKTKNGNNANSNGETSRTNNNDTLSLIPLVIPNQEFVNGFLSCIVSDDSVHIKLYNGQEYQQYGYNTNNNTVTAQKLANQIIAMENDIFGHNIYYIKDKNLFSTTAASNNKTKLIRVSESQQNARTSSYTTTSCYNFEIDEENEGQVVGCTHPTFSNCTCNPIVVSMDCFEFSYYFESQNGSSSGVATGSWCTGNNSTTSGASSNGPASASTLGWQYYPSYMSYSQHFTTWQVTIEDGNKINNWKNNNIDTTKLDPCLQTILDELLNCSGTNPIGRMLAKFDRAVGDSVNVEKFNIKYVTKDIQSTFVGVTEYLNFNPVSQEFFATITIDSAISSKATDIYNATTIIHESIHAYLAYLLYRRNISSSAPNPFSWYQTKPLDTLFNVYVDTLIAIEKRYNNFNSIDSASATYEHNFMANKLVNLIAETIKKYADSKGIVGVTDEYF